MSEQTHLIALDPNANVVAVKDYLKNDEAFTHWWNHVPGVFIVTSRLSATEITDRVRPITGEATFIVIGVKLDETEGWLPQRSWKWIKHRAREVATLQSDTVMHSAQHS